MIGDLRKLDFGRIRIEWIPEYVPPLLRCPRRCCPCWPFLRTGSGSESRAACWHVFVRLIRCWIRPRLHLRFLGAIQRSFGRFPTSCSSLNVLSRPPFWPPSLLIP